MSKADAKKPTKDEKIAELTDSLQRVQAEFENFKKYQEKKQAEHAVFAQASMVEQLLPLIDSFEMAMKHEPTDPKFAEGMKMIFSQLHSTLEHAGVKPIDVSSGKFDPFLHEALLTEESDKEDGVILEELQKGYMLGERVLRHTKVKIAKNPTNNSTTKDSGSGEEVQTKK